jgi:hypothetical protein
MKKDETRFTIRFNPIDPRQFKAMNALEAAGRRKATLIADAVCEYLERRGENIEAFSLPVITVPVAEPNLRNKTPKENSFSPPPEPAEVIEKNDVDSSDTVSFDDEIHDAILRGLAAFDL